MKKVLSFVLVIAMVLSSMSFAFAGTFEDVAGDYEKAIETLKGLGIVTGYEDGTYRPEKTVTRAEMAKLMVEILGYGDLVQGAKSNFSDMQGHWADAWVALAAGRNIVLGDGNGKFRPDATVTYNEVLTMVVRGLGYTDDSNEIKSMSWPTNFKVKAAELGITDGVKMSTTGADRGGVAQALYNALDASLVSVNTDGDIVYLKGSGDKTMPLLTRIAQEAGSYVDAEKRYEFKVEPKHLDANNKDYAGNVVDLEPYVYQTVEAYAAKSDSKLIVYVADSYSDSVTGTLKVNTDIKKINVELADESKEIIDFKKSEVPVFYNGKEVKLDENTIENGGVYNGTNYVGLEGAKVTVILDNDEAIGIVARQATHANRIARAYKKDDVKIGTINLPLKNSDVNLAKVTVTGEVDDVFDIKIDDIVVAYGAGGAVNAEAQSNVKLVVVRDTVEGKISERNSKGTEVYIDGTKYSVSKIAGVDAFTVGQEGTFFLDDAGKVFAREASTASDAKDYAVVIQTFNGLKSSDRYIAKPEVKLINAKGEVVTYVVNKDAKYKDNSVILLDHGTEGTKTQIDPAKITSRSLVKFKLNDDGEISKIEVLAKDVLASLQNNDLDTTKASFDVAKDAPIFNVKAGATTDKKDYDVVEVANLPKTIDVYFSDINADGQYKVIVANDAVTSTGNYALITSRGYVLNSDDETVQKITAYINGEKVIIEAKNDTVTVTAGAINTAKIAELTLDNGKLSANVTDSELDTKLVQAGLNGKDITRSTEARIGVATRDANGVVTSTTWVELESDAVAYVVDTDGEFKSVGSVDSLVGYSVVGLYDTNGKDGVDIIVVK